MDIPIKKLKELSEQITLPETDSKYLISWYILLHKGIQLELTNIPVTNWDNYNEKLEIVKNYFKGFVVE